MDDDSKEEKSNVSTTETAPGVTNFMYGYPTPDIQNVSGQQIMNNLFFTTKLDWPTIRLSKNYDYIVIGTGFCAYAFMQRTLENNAKTRILCLDRGAFFLPEHFQNLPLAFANTVGINGITETYPWTLSARTMSKNNGKGYIQFQRGMLPVFGGRSLYWSSWCPRPTEKELRLWPEAIVQALLGNDQRLFKSAEKLLNVVPSNMISTVVSINEDTSAERRRRTNQKKNIRHKPVFLYGKMQEEIYDILNSNMGKVKAFHRIIYAPMAVASPDLAGVSFEKFSTSGPILSLIDKYPEMIDIVPNCVVQTIVSQRCKDCKERTATALTTSRGNVNIGNAKVILGMGTLPATTLVRNSFSNKLLPNVGHRYSAHFISAITARIKRNNISKLRTMINSPEIGAIFLDGLDVESGLEFHIQLSLISNSNADTDMYTLFRYAPDVVSTASQMQLETSKDYIVFVCAVLGESDWENEDSWFLKDAEVPVDPTTNMVLQMVENEKDMHVWDVMDTSTYEMLEVMMCDSVPEVEYWHGSPTDGKWIANVRPSVEQIRVPGVVHESSTMHIGGDDDVVASVDLNYKLKHVNGVYVTGGSLWPRSGSWNPTMTMCALAQDLADKFTCSK